MAHSKTFNFINSIKGGCGKTTFSVFLAKYLVRMEEAGSGTKAVKGSEDKGGECLLLDMDLMGSAMQYLFQGHSADKGDKYINEAVRGRKSSLFYVEKNKLSDDSTIHAIFANPDIGQREKYRTVSRGNYSPVVQYNVFRGGLREFLQKIKGETYRHFIFDMPPNSDGFSSAALDCVLDASHSVAEKDDKINMFYVLGMDMGQLDATKKEIVKFLTQEDNKAIDNLFIVFNNNIVRNGETDIDELWETHVEEFREELKNKVQEQELKKVHFLMLGAVENYASYCSEAKGLNNAKKIDELIPNLPAERFAEYDKSYTSFELLSKDTEYFKKRMMGLEG